MAKDEKKLTTGFGMPVDNDLNSVTAGPKGPVLVQDVHLIEKLAHFDRERIPERVVHAKGAGAHGHFEVSRDVSMYTRAKFLSKPGKRTEVFIRFSTVGGEKGSADSERDPATNLKDPDMFWDFLSLTPESIHQVTILFSDRGTPKGFRNVNGYSSHTYMWYNEKGEYYWIKYHFKTEQGIQNFAGQEADRMRGIDPDVATRDLSRAIARGEFPAWRVEVQIMTPEQAKTYKFDPFDITKVWPHADFPPITIGRMVLDRNPENYFAEVEQAAFSPGNFVPGIGPSPDKMLQGRLFSYHDTHRHRLGPNYHLLPVNAPKAAPMASYQRDGAMRFDNNGGGGPNYWPNSFGGPTPVPGTGIPPIDVAGAAARHAYVLGDVDFVQAGALYRKVMTDMDREHLVGNIVGHLGGAKKAIQLRQTALFFKADPEYGERVAKGLGLNVDEVKKLAAMSQEERVKATQV